VKIVGPALLASLSLAIATPVRAGDGPDCVSSYEGGQRLRLSGKLRASRQELAQCAQPQCPALVREDCVTWLREVDEALPTVILRARTPSGRDIVDVRVTCDGAVLASPLNGAPVAVDPGERRLRFESTGFLPKEQTILAVQTEKDRVVQVVLEPIPPRPEPVQPPKPRSSVPYVLAGVGAAALVVGGYFGLRGWRHVSDLHDDPCSATKTCNPSDADAARRELVVADVAIGVGVVAVGVALWMFFSSNSSPPKSASAWSWTIR
jgi:hypothetical protein